MFNPVEKILGKNISIDKSPYGKRLPYEKREFEDSATGERFSGKELKELKNDSIGVKSEYDVTKRLKLGKSGIWKIKPKEYDREHHITDISELKRVK